MYLFCTTSIMNIFSSLSLALPHCLLAVTIPPEIPVLSSPPTIVKVNQAHLELQFLSWEASPDSGDKPSSYMYVVEMRREGTEDWQELRVFTGPESENVKVQLQYDFLESVTYDIRVIPILVHEGISYRGYGAETTFTVPVPGTVPLPTSVILTIHLS